MPVEHARALSKPSEALLQESYEGSEEEAKGLRDEAETYLRERETRTRQNLVPTTRTIVTCLFSGSNYQDGVRRSNQTPSIILHLRSALQYPHIISS